MTTAQNIAAKLNVLESAIVRIEEWASVLFCVVKGVGARFVSKKLKAEEKKMTIYSQIMATYELTQREEEIYDLGRKADKKLISERRNIQFDREETRKALMKLGWEKLQSLGYKKYDRRGNAAYESGHSDYIESSENYVFWGVVSPDGKEFPGSVSWTEGIIPAIEHAGL